MIKFSDKILKSRCESFNKISYDLEVFLAMKRIFFYRMLILCWFYSIIFLVRGWYLLIGKYCRGQRTRGKTFFNKNFRLIFFKNRNFFNCLNKFYLLSYFNKLWLKQWHYEWYSLNYNKDSFNFYKINYNELGFGYIFYRKDFLGFKLNTFFGV